MKRFFVPFLVILSLGIPAYGQKIDDLFKAGGALISSAQARQEKDKLSKASAKYNSDQPNVSLAEARAVLRRQGENWGYNDRQQRWMDSNIPSSVTAVGGHPVWDDKDIDDESASHAHQRGNKEVDQSTVPGRGKIKYRNFILEYEFIDFEKSSEQEIALGRWWNQNQLRMSRETAYFGLVLTIRNGDTGEVMAVYKTLGTASSADNVGAQVANGFFSNSASYSSSGNSEDDRRFRAMENALRQMGEVIKQKCR